MRPEGSLVELSWHISLHTSPSLRLAEVTDITERRAAEREREYLLANERAARSEAEHANRVKDEFLAMISHELRSPLNAIVGWANYLKMAKSTDIRDYAKGIDAIDRNATAQERLIADLLDVSSITTGKMRLDLKPVDIAEVARNSIDGQFGSAESKSISIETAIDARPAHYSRRFWKTASDHVQSAGQCNQIYASWRTYFRFASKDSLHMLRFR